MHVLHTLAHRSPPCAAAARSAYAQASLAQRVESASPHALVQMLYDRLLLLLREAAAAAAAGEPARRLKATAKAIAITDTLAATLDTRRGGAVADALKQLYALLSDRLLAGDPQGLAEAETAAAAAAAAWREIRPRA